MGALSPCRAADLVLRAHRSDRRCRPPHAAAPGPGRCAGAGRWLAVGFDVGPGTRRRGRPPARLYQAAAPACRPGRGVEPPQRSALPPRSTAGLGARYGVTVAARCLVDGELRLALRLAPGLSPRRVP